VAPKRLTKNERGAGRRIFPRTSGVTLSVYKIRRGRKSAKALGRLVVAERPRSLRRCFQSLNNCFAVIPEHKFCVDPCPFVVRRLFFSQRRAAVDFCASRSVSFVWFFPSCSLDHGRWQQFVSQDVQHIP